MLLTSVICVLFALRVSTIKQQERVIDELTEMGAQLQVSENRSAAAAWLLGTTRQVTGMQFLGPRIGDENVEDIAHAASQLRGLVRITFAESRITDQGERQLRSMLENVEVDVSNRARMPTHR